MKTRVLGSVIVTVIVAMTLGVVLARFQRAEHRNRVGVILPLTGPLAFVGESARDGFRLAAKQSEGMFGLEILDGKGTAKDSIMAYRSITEGSRVNAIFCVASVAAKAICEQNPPMPVYMTIVSDTSIARKSEKFFNLTLNSEQEVSTIFSYFKSVDKKTMALIYQQDDLGRYAKDTVMNDGLGIQVTACEEIASESGYADVVARVCKERPDFIFIAVVGKSAAILVRKLVENGFKGAISSFSGFNTPSVLNQAGEAAEGVYVCCTAYDIGEGKKVRAFKERYKSSYNRSPDFIAAYAYSLMKIYLNSPTDERYHTLFGEIVRKPDGELVFPLYVGRITKGGVKVVKN